MAYCRRPKGAFGSDRESKRTDRRVPSQNKRRALKVFNVSGILRRTRLRIQYSGALSLSRRFSRCRGALLSHALKSVEASPAGRFAQNDCLHHRRILADQISVAVSGNRLPIEVRVAEELSRLSVDDFHSAPFDEPLHGNVVAIFIGHTVFKRLDVEE